MSDGPHRSLNMRKGWKRLCKLADNAATSPQEICDAVVPALEQDWRGDMSSGLFNRVRQILSEPQGSLFVEQRIGELEALRRQTAGHGLARSFLDCAIQTVIEGGGGPAAILTTTQNAVIDRAARGIKQAEEHYIRESNAPRAENVRVRMEAGIQGAALEALARRLSNTDSAPAAPAPNKQQGLDDGVQL